MIRLSKLTDYGILLMAQMASDPEQWQHKARDLAQQTHIPLPTVGKILKLLSRGNLLISRRGINGGYSLSKLPQEISVWQIIAALQGQIGIAECSAKPGRCELEPYCLLSGCWRILSDALGLALRDLTLPDLIDQERLAAKCRRLIPDRDVDSGKRESARVLMPVRDHATQRRAGEGF